MMDAIKKAHFKKKIHPQGDAYTRTGTHRDAGTYTLAQGDTMVTTIFVRVSCCLPCVTVRPYVPTSGGQEFLIMYWVSFD